MAGLFFIWIVPIICLIIMACNGATNGIKIQSWVSVALVIIVCVYYIKGKKEIGKVKDRQLLKDGFIHWWVRLIEYIVVAIPFAVGLLLIESVKSNINDARLFIIISLISVSIGYVLLMIDSKTKESEKKGNGE